MADLTCNCSPCIPPGAVGATLNVERLVRLVAQHRVPYQWEGASAAVKPSQSDVLVCSRGGDGLLQVSIVG